jgi:hypothetical protein
LAALLHIGPDELLGVLLEHLVDLVQNRVDVVSELVLALLDVLGPLRRAVLLLLAAAGSRLTLSAGVLCRHCRNLRDPREPPRSLNAILARG